MNVTFTTPLALFGLLTLPVIAALHMFRSRKQVVAVSSLSLWKFLNPQLSGSTARRLPITWLLFIDLLIAASLSLALAGPRLDLTRPVRDARHLILILDTSTSMAAADVRPSRFEAALSDLIDLAGTGFEQDVVTVIGFSEGARPLADSRAGDFSAELAALDDRRPAGEGANLTAALALAKGALDPQVPAEVHVFTDAAFPKPEPAGFDLPLQWHLYGESGSNQAVLSVRAVALSDLKFQVFARAANFAPNAVTRSLVINADGADLGTVEIELSPESTTAYTWEIVGNVRLISVRLDGRDELPLDDSAFTTPESGFADAWDSGTVRVAVVSATPGPALKALEAIPGTEIQVIAPDDYLPGSQFGLVVFQGFLPDRWPGGTVLVIDPPGGSNLLSASDTVPVGDLPFPQPDELLEDLNFTGLRLDSVIVIDQAPVELEPVLNAGAYPIILHGQVGLTNLVVVLAQVSDANGTPTAFARHPAFPVLIANVVREAAGIHLPGQLALGQALALPSPARYPSVRITAPGSEETQLGTDRPQRWTAAQAPGFYSIQLTDLEGAETNIIFGVNAGSLEESRIAPMDWPAETAGSPLPDAVSDQPVSLVPWLLVFAVLSLLVEAWLSWR